MFEPRWERRGEDPLPDVCADSGQLLDIIDVERRQLLRDARSKPLVLQEVAISLRRRREAVGHRHAGFARWLIISPSEEFLPPTVSTS